MRATDQSHFPAGRYRDLLRIYRGRDRDAFEALKPQDPNWYDGFRPSSLVGGGFFRLHLAEASGSRSFEQELSLYAATCSYRFRAPGLDNMWSVAPDFEITAFASQPREVLAIRVRRSPLPLRSFTWRLNRERHQLLPEARAQSDGPLAWLEQELTNGDRYAIAVLQDGLPADITTTRRCALGEVSTDDSHELVFWLAAATQRDSSDPADLARVRVREAAAAGFDQVEQEHRQSWRSIWDRAWVCCSDKSVERPWYVSNYLCGSILRPGRVSPGLQGMWCRENHPPWDADFHGNVNIQAVYHGVLGSNHVELFEPYARLYQEMLPQCRRDTRDYFEMDGARLPHAGSIDGHEICEPNWPTLAVSMAPSMWIARMYWWAYLHTLDRDFLARIAYPILRDVALYYRGLLELAGRDGYGRYLVEPSTWAEYRGTEIEGWSTNSSYEIASHMAAFQQAADAADILGVDPELAAAWREVLRALPDLPTNEQNAWLRWPQGDGTADTSSFFYLVFPCEVAGAYNGPEELRAQARASWEVARTRQLRAGFGGTVIAAAVRLGDADSAFGLASEISPNGLVADSDNGTMQADHGPGMSLALNAMLALGIDGAIVPFAGMPPDVDVAFHSLRAPGAVLVSGEQRDGRVRCLSLQSLCGGSLRVLNPFRPPEDGDGARIAVHIPSTDAPLLEASVAFREPIEWNAEADVIHTLTSASGQCP